MSTLTLDAAHVAKASTADLQQWREVLLMCRREGVARMGKSWLANAKVGLPLIGAELKRRNS